MQKDLLTPYTILSKGAVVLLLKALLVMTVINTAVPIEPATCLIVLLIAVPCGIILLDKTFKPAVCTELSEKIFLTF